MVLLFLNIFKKYFFKILIIENDLFKIYLNDFFLLKFVYFIKKSFLFQFKSLVDLFCIDWLTKFYRFELIYNFVSYFFNFRFFLSILINIDKKNPYGLGVESLNFFFNSSNWLEREIWDLFGIYFKNHKDLRRILSDYGFFGFALRKDYPLSGFKEIRYDELNKIIITENVNFTQEFRVFNFINPWF
jgi:NADH:ubiquinone oxidoreductase subunit C